MTEQQASVHETWPPAHFPKNDGIFLIRKGFHNLKRHAEDAAEEIKKHLPGIDDELCSAIANSIADRYDASIKAGTKYCANGMIGNAPALPEGTRLEDVRLVVYGHGEQEIEVRVNDKPVCRASAGMLGMGSKEKNGFSIDWIVLCLMALGDHQAKYDAEKAPGNFKTRMSRLNGHLRTFFGLPDDGETGENSPIRRRGGRYELRIMVEISKDYSQRGLLRDLYGYGIKGHPLPTVQELLSREFFE